MNNAHHPSPAPQPNPQAADPFPSPIMSLPPLCSAPYCEGVGGAVSALALNGQGNTGGEGLEAQDGELVAGLNLVVVLCGRGVST